MVKYRCLCLVFYVFFSCSSRQEIFYDLASAEILEASKVLYQADDVGILTELQLQDSLLIAIDDLGEKKFVIIHSGSGEEIMKYGEKGRGPGEFFSPEFVLNGCMRENNSSGLLLYDDNSMKFLEIDFRKVVNNSDHPIDAWDFPEELTGCTNFSLLEGRIIGKSSSNQDSGMFFIYDENSRKKVWTPYYPYYEGEVSKGMCNYVYNVNLVAHEKSNRIICGMTFADLILVYDLKGSRVKSYRFSENDRPDMDPARKMIRPGAAVYQVHLCATKEYCYFLRLGYNSGEEANRDKGVNILQLSWKGDVVRTYKVREYLYGFCVDEERGKLLGIASEDGDRFSILEYNLKSGID